MIVEDTITKNQKFKQESMQKLQSLIALNAPHSIIDNARMIANMDYAEYKTYLKEQEKKHKANCLEYARNNSIQESIVNQIYTKESLLEYNAFAYDSFTYFLKAIDPLKFMSNDDFEYELYDSFLHHAYELYTSRFAKIHALED